MVERKHHVRIDANERMEGLVLDLVLVLIGRVKSGRHTKRAVNGIDGGLEFGVFPVLRIVSHALLLHEEVDDQGRTKK